MMPSGSGAIGVIDEDVDMIFGSQQRADVTVQCEIRQFGSPPALCSSQFSRSIKGQDQGSSSVRSPQISEAICNQRRMGRDRVNKAPKTTHTMKSACTKSTDVARVE